MGLFFNRRAKPGKNYTKFTDVMKDVKVDAVEEIARRVKLKAIEIAKVAINEIPIKTGYTIRQTFITSGKGKGRKVQTREQARVAKRKLRKRRGGINKAAERNKALKRIVNKIMRAKDERVARLVVRGKAPFRIVLGSYYSAAINTPEGGHLGKKIMAKIEQLDHEGLIKFE